MLPSVALAPSAIDEYLKAAGAAGSANSFNMRHVKNPNAAGHDPAAPTPAPTLLAASFSDENRNAKAMLATWPEYAGKASPLVAVPDLAAALGVASIQIKCEGGRFGIGSFKALGAPYAVAALLKRQNKRQVGGEAASGVSDLSTQTFSTASDGNHGVAVAWAARRFGASARVYLHAGVSAERFAAITKLGAQAVRAGSNYEESIDICKAESKAKGFTIVQDVSWPGYEEIPKDICAGYTLVASEILEQLAASEEDPPTHVVINCGVGGFAAAICGYMWDALGNDRPIFITAEPGAADPVLRSGAAGRMVACPGNLDTIQGGLACGEVSPVAFNILRGGADVLAAVDDGCVAPSVKLLAHASPAMPVGESAVAGLAVIVAAAASEHGAREAFGITPDSRIVCVACEGPTDVSSFETISGQKLADLAASPYSFPITLV